MPRLPTRGGSLRLNRRECESAKPIGFDMTHRRLDVAIVADDITGALDAAAPFATRGLDTRVLLDFERAAPAVGSDMQVLSLTSESRHLLPAAADERVWNTTRAALARAPRVLLKKIDSTLRGNIATEIMAVLRASELRHALIAPAVPRHGRIMRTGEVFIDGVPLRQTEIGFDALSPPPSAPLPQVLNEASKDLIVHVWARGATFGLSMERGIHAYVADCETETDLDAIARFALSHCDEVLPVGASGLAAAMARQFAQKLATGTLFPNPSISKHARKPVLFVIGSRTAASAEQTARLCAAGAEELVMPLSEHTRDSDWLLECSVSQSALPVALIIRPEASREPSQFRASEVAQTLGRTAAVVVRRLQIDVVIMVGGDTAFEIFKALCVLDASVSGEIMPSIATGDMLVDGRSVTFITKAGGFGDADVLVEIFRHLKNQ
jgi:D-threonate/D-erythronate kinase